MTEDMRKAVGWICVGLVVALIGFIAPFETLRNLTLLAAAVVGGGGALWLGMELLSARRD